MYLSKLAVINYKSCKNLVLNFTEDLPNTFIGKTDVGKSTILSAIGFLLDDKSNPNLVGEGQQTSDLSTTPAINQEYEAVFSELGLPKFEVEDSSSVIVVGVFNKQDGDFGEEFDNKGSNHLKWAIVSHSAEHVAVLRQFNEHFQNGRFFLCAKDKKDERLALWNKNQTILGNLRSELDVTHEDIDNANKAGRYKNLEVFQAIYNKLETTPQWDE